MDPTVKDTVADPAAGTGGFLLVAQEHAARETATLTPDERRRLRDAGETLRRRLLNDFDVHTLRRLPTGILYAQVPPKV